MAHWFTFSFFAGRLKETDKNSKMRIDAIICGRVKFTTSQGLWQVGNKLEAAILKFSLQSKKDPGIRVGQKYSSVSVQASRVYSLGSYESNYFQWDTLLC